LVQRLARIFGLDAGLLDERVTDGMCRAWLEPTFQVGRLYHDSLVTLAKLRSGGLKTGLVSNTPWGSPGAMWREELARLGLAPLLDALVFCTDVGRRKPDPRPFLACCEQLGVQPDEAIFVGDHPRWDVEGAAAAGLRPVLIDRGGSAQDSSAVADLSELLALVSAQA
jgi:putative hydrolase of the HAD superfamily